MPVPWLKQMIRELRATLRRPGAQLTRGQRFLRYCLDLARHARQELRDDHAAIWAAALTYRTIFGFVPMLVMALIVFRAFGGFDGSQAGLTEQVYKFLEIQVEVAEAFDEAKTPDQPAEPLAKPVTLLGPVVRQWVASSYARSMAEADDDTADAVAAERRRANAEMKARIDRLVGDLAEGATSISIRGIGVIGMLVLIWAALGLIVTVERTFNVIFDAPAGRPWHIRVPIYWAVITLGPVLLWASFYFSGQLIAVAESVAGLGWLFRVLNRFTAVGLTWLLFLLLFTLMPNTKVAIRPAMVGALVSALAWELMKTALGLYVENAVLSPTQTRLYGSLALIPLLLFWVYLTWIVVLLGLEVTQILQTLPASRMGHFEHDQSAPVTRDPWLVIPVMSAVAEAFDKGETIGVGEIADQLNAAPSTVSQITEELVGRGLLHRLSRDEAADGLTLAMPPGRIRIADLIAAVPEGDDASARPGHALLRQLAEAQNAALADLTLANHGGEGGGGSSRRRAGDG